MTSRHENRDQDKYSDENGLPRLRDGELRQNPDHHGEDDHQKEKTNQDVHMIPQYRISPEEASKECDHVVGTWDCPDPLLRKNTISDHPYIRFVYVFDFCPKCGIRLIPDDGFYKKTCECGASIQPGEFFAEFPNNSGKYFCNKCCFLACERADAIRAPRDTGFVTPSGFDSH